MLPVEMESGNRTWVNVLFIKGLEAAQDLNKAVLVMSDGQAITVKEEPQRLANLITSMLRSVSGG